MDTTDTLQAPITPSLLTAVVMNTDISEVKQLKDDSEARVQGNRTIHANLLTEAPRRERCTVCRK